MNGDMPTNVDIIESKCATCENTLFRPIGMFQILFVLLWNDKQSVHFVQFVKVLVAKFIDKIIRHVLCYQHTTNSKTLTYGNK